MTTIDYLDRCAKETTSKDRQVPTTLTTPPTPDTSTDQTPPASATAVERNTARYAHLTAPVRKELHIALQDSQGAPVRRLTPAQVEHERQVKLWGF